MSLRYALLGLLDNQPASGYDLMKIFNSSMANVWPATQSQVYTELNKMAGTGLITVSAEGARGRKVYEITRDGREALRIWLREPPTRKPRRSDLLLRVFFLDVISPAEAREIFRAHREHAVAQKAHLNQILERIDGDVDSISVNGRIALEFGLRKAEMEIGWADWAFARLDADGPSALSDRRTQGRSQLTP
ncbi:putative PadR family transcriptional regulator [Gordonia effusa NBRC 100432]|uniref:Putative PadR family transcriptional regulator n=1 Tax=Gordonia effusa NBRC 100432 TaxID=1077974 RepID=H0R1Z7_9ACTN|nr:PadR family transcriptional regulator [Gordonia effusa]GAB19102.1 putative PadR family transcriptional regulator [Gordonia effusa NBRC 100432]